MNSTPTYLGNQALLEKQKVGFIASRKFSTLDVLPTLDWAMQMSKQTEIAVVSGFHSHLERNVLDILLRGRCPIIVVLARCMYRKLPKQYEEAMMQNRLLIISYEKESVTRASEESAHKRNSHVEQLANEMLRIQHD